ncbi:UL16-binding protein 1-like isoform X1 [Equus asinus]|uniref:UL16-binding protein 1-like isoform X1 n=1 Tax=Equus asinus TaxID=9793 RepID=UPI0038F61B6D
MGTLPSHLTTKGPLIPLPEDTVQQRPPRLVPRTWSSRVWIRGRGFCQADTSCSSPSFCIKGGALGWNCWVGRQVWVMHAVQPSPSETLWLSLRGGGGWGGLGVPSPYPKPHLCFSFTEALSLSYNFTVLPKASRGQPWCEVQGQVHEKTFLSYDCGSQEVKSLSLLGEEVKGMRAWQEQMETLRDVGDFLRQQLLDLKLEKYTDRAKWESPSEQVMRLDPLPLQGRMLCQWRANGRTRASWQFGFQGQTFLRFDSKNGTWTVLHPGGRRMKEKWESDRHVTKFFWNISMGDCRSWLDCFMVHWEKMLETTASPTVATVKGQSRASVITPIAWVLLVTLTCSILIDL